MSGRGPTSIGGKATKVIVLRFTPEEFNTIKAMVRHGPKRATGAALKEHVLRTLGITPENELVKARLTPPGPEWWGEA